MFLLLFNFPYYCWCENEHAEDPGNAAAPAAAVVEPVAVQNVPACPVVPTLIPVVEDDGSAEAKPKGEDKKVTWVDIRRE